MEEREKVLKLQQDFEAGKIVEEELSEEELTSLENLYNGQIALLKEMKDMYKNKIEYHKNNIKRNMEIIQNMKSKK